MRTEGAKMIRIYSKIQAWLSTSDDEGASAVEYGLLVGLIAVAIIVIVGTLGDQLASLFTTVSNKLTGATTP